VYGLLLLASHNLWRVSKAEYASLQVDTNRRWLCKSCQRREELDFSTETRWGKYIGHAQIKQKTDDIYKEMSS